MLTEYQGGLENVEDKVDDMRNLLLSEQLEAEQAAEKAGK